MRDRPYNVLFLCTGNSARSILAEALLNHRGKGRFRAFSAGSFPKGQVHPLALQLLQSTNLPTEGLRSKSWNEFAAPGAPAIDFVITVCDNAAGEACPVWPGKPVTAHWGVADPAAVAGDAQQGVAFRKALGELEARVNLFVNIPIESLDRLALQQAVRDIGQADQRPVTLRRATLADAPACLAIYRPFVETTAVSFEEVVPSVEEFAGRIEDSLSTWTWLVAEHDGRCIGYAYGHSHRARAAYRWSVEVTIYVDSDHRRQGVGRQLYEQLFADLAQLGYCNAFAGITQPNESSMALHRAVGFEYIGTFKSVGRKFDRWHDVAWFQRKL